MHVILWRFEVPESSRAAFERIYGEQGDWAVLFSNAEGFFGTSLMRDAGRVGWYLTIDRWESQAAFETFRLAAASEYEALDQQCLQLTTCETRLGSLTAEKSAW